MSTVARVRAVLERMPHLLSALLAMALVAAGLTSAEALASSVERRFIHALAPQQFLQKNQGSALQREAFRQPDLLPIYGSSELIALDEPYHPSRLFRTYPTGFTVFPVADGGTPILIMAHRLAAVGPELRGKKVVVALDPGRFILPAPALSEYERAYYAGTYSRLQAGELAFSARLSADLKQTAARRTLEYPGPLAADPLLAFALQRLADGSALGRALYAAVLPLGKLQNRALRLQDHWQTLDYIRKEPNLDRPVPRQTGALDWQSLATGAEQYARQRAEGNPFGFDDDWFQGAARELRLGPRFSATDELFSSGLERSRGWDDLEILLRVLSDLGAEPLVLCAPIPGTWYDYRGISPRARAAFYEKFRAMVESHGAVPLGFADHDGDRYFLRDPFGHPSRKGWVHYDEALDAFYHGTLR